MIRTLDACKLSKTLNLFMVKIWDFPNHILGLTKIQYPFHTLFRSCIIISYLVQADTNSAALFRIWFRRLLLPTFPRPFPLSMLLCKWTVRPQNIWSSKKQTTTLKREGESRHFWAGGMVWALQFEEGTFDMSQQVFSAIVPCQA